VRLGHDGSDRAGGGQEGEPENSGAGISWTVSRRRHTDASSKTRATLLARGNSAIHREPRSRVGEIPATAG
jgi:hypothetical protein